MPQASRGNARQPDSREAQKAIDKEQKRSRGAMSCAECRRLKLKCDKTVPCSSCKRRGCPAICPNGSLTTGQGTRFVLADTEKLHQKIAQMSDRIRQLEDALAIVQTSPSEQHPLLHRDLLDIKSIIDLHAAVDEETAGKSKNEVDDDSQYIESFGTLAIRDDGAATFYGPSAGSESLLIGESAVPPATNFSPGDRSQHNERLPSAVRHLSKSFPLAPVFTDEVDFNYLIQNYLPPWHRARHLSELYLQQAPWFFGAVTKRQLMEENLPLWYAEAADLIYPGSVAPPVTSENEANDALSKGPHELALMFVIFCFGALTDHRLPPAPDNEEADMYFKLTRAALNLEPVLDRPPSVATIQTLALLAIYQGLCSGENSIESTWGIFGLATKLAQSIGLHRDCARWQLPTQEVQKRRALFWELFITDGWQSLATGRLATFYLPFVDCELPNDPDSTVDEDGSILLSFPAWKARFGFQCISTVIQHAQTAKVPKYSVIIELDRKIRDMELPKYAQRPPREGAELAEAMKHYMPRNYRHLTLLYVHRCFFAEAVSNNPTNPMNSPYAPSFLAGYRSACELISDVRTQFDLFPAQIARFWVLWTHAFSSSVMLSSVVTHASGSGSRSKITTAALTELRRAVNLFKEASAFGGRAGKFLPILERLLQKAEQAYSTATPSVTRRDIFSGTGPTKPKDELSIFRGQINKVVTKAPVTPSSGRASHTPPASSTSNPSQSPLLQGEAAPPQAFSNIHPSLREQWSRFEGDLNAQLHNAQRDAYYTEDDAFSVPAHAEELRGMATAQEGPSQAQSVQQQQHYPVTQPPQGYHDHFSAPSHGFSQPVEAQTPYQNESQRRESAYSSGSQGQHYQHEPQYAQPLPQSHHHQPDRTQYHPDPHQQHPQQQQQQQQQHHHHPDPQHQHQHQQYYSQEQPGFYTHVPYQSSSSFSTADPRAPGDYNAEPSQSYWQSTQQSYQAQESTVYYQSSHYDNQYRTSQQYQAPAPAAEYPSVTQQHHLQETWQSFNVYVGSSRPLT
ncbi:fungal-specific transcription factor domain-containing protein [Suillus paluster]|uniref:fungal-specific transcription factor domain-containing protein n=1 Tax=Suillus paluster TaxID=48578 RepID=UPI001B863BCD|nr:fungal-specific transcription factor domain-containing protein [Suillus paluster]KAG1737552.1 fungal-specific transcription factor domain-containing protein [Suillus paluster]